MRFQEPRLISPATITSVSVQALAIVLMFIAPCWYGSASWEVQQVLFAIGIATAGLIAVHFALAAVAGHRLRGPNALSWTLFALGGLAIAQTQPYFSWDGGENYTPGSVTMQRWALGYTSAPDAISEGLISTGVAVGNRTLTEPCSLQSVPEARQRLALSVEPMTSRAAAGSLFLAGLLVWVGSSFFSHRAAYPTLLACAVVLGSIIAALGILNVLVPDTRTWIGLGGNAFATFVSKNSAGAFLNVSLAAASGFAFWSFHRVWKNERHRPQRSRRGAWEPGPTAAMREVLAKLDALQIASILAVVWIATAILVSLSRGAAVSGLAAALATALVTLPGKYRHVAFLVSPVLAVLAIGLMVFFQLDEQVAARLESLGDIDVGNESEGGRLYIWSVSWRAALFYGWLGSGLGTFHYASLPFQKPSSIGWFYHAESIYCEAIVTMGYLGLIALLSAIVGSFRSLRLIYVSRRFPDFAPMLVAGMFLLLSQSMHSAVDFAMILPGVYVPAALIMGAALGVYPESLRIIRKLKYRPKSSGQGTMTDNDEPRPSRIACVTALAMALGCMLALHYCRQAAIPLGVAEAVDEEFRRLDKLSLEERGDERLETLVDRAAQSGVVLSDSPYLERLLAECLCYDDRRRQWKSRPLESDPKLAWTETDPFLVRLAYDRIDAGSREAWLRSIGGEERLETLRKANAYYAKSRSGSPLDWHALWGNIHTSLDCQVTDLAVFGPVMQRTSGHLPQLLTSASIFFNDSLSEQDRLQLWRSALQTSPNASIGIGKLMSSQFSDDTVPLEIFPNHPNYLYGLAREVFTKKAFPKTHQFLCRRAIDAVASQPKLSSFRAAILLADIASESGDAEAEMKHLSRYLQYKPDDTLSWIRLANLQIQFEKWDEADKSLRKLKQSDRNHPAIPDLTKKINNRSNIR